MLFWRPSPSLCAPAVNPRPPRRLRAASVPGDLPGNPYLALLQDALARRGIETVRGDPRLGWAWAARSEVSVVHLHWPDLFVHGRGARVERRPWMARPLFLARAGRFLAVLAVLRACGIRIVWTVHNIRPHDQQFPRLERLVAHALARVTQSIVVHTGFSRRLLVEEYGWSDRPYWIAPHGNYLHSYPRPRRGRQRMRSSLGIADDAFVFLVFGQLRRYKRLDEVISAFRHLDGQDVRLVVAGAPTDPTVRDAVVRAAGADLRIHLLLDFIDDADVADLHAMADAAIISYVEGFSSGALLLALSNGLPIVAPSESSAPETAGPPALVAYDSGGLADALQRTRDGSPGERRRAALQA